MDLYKVIAIVAQRPECLLAMQNVVGSTPIYRL
jgi:hypothetical protein